MTTQQENCIDSQLERYRERLEDQDEDYIERKIEDALEKAEEKERDRIDYLNTVKRLSLHGAAYEAHMEKFRKDTENELYEHFKAECDKENDRLLQEYREELEKEMEEESESED